MSMADLVAEFVVDSRPPGTGLVRSGAMQSSVREGTVERIGRISIVHIPSCFRLNRVEGVDVEPENAVLRSDPVARVTAGSVSSMELASLLSSLRA